jgi:hypothetical protein
VVASVAGGLGPVNPPAPARTNWRKTKLPFGE